MAQIKIDVINECTVLDDAQIQAQVAAVLYQIKNHFRKPWGIDADLYFVPKGSRPNATHWWVGVFDNSDEAGALGYHDLTNTGLPLGKVFAGTDLQYGYKPSVTLSHEVLEMLADPDIDLTAFIQTSSTKGTLYAYEVCDPVEADSDGYMCQGQQVSDFVLPSWFETFWPTGSTKFDMQGLLKSPLMIRPEGYMSVFHVTGGSGWTQIYGSKAAQKPRYSARPPLGSRRDRRRTPREQWLKSIVAKQKIHGKVK